MVSFRFVSSGRPRVHSFPRSIPYYGGLWRKVLGDGPLFLAFAFAATLHGVGHGATALAAGLLGSALTSQSRLISSPFRVVSDPATLAFVGVAATLLKAAGATVGATLQSRLAQNMVSSVRQVLAGRLLAWGTPMPAGQLSARLAVRFREIETGVQDGLLAGLRALLTLVPLGVALYAVSSTLAWGALLVLAPFALAMSFARRGWRKSHAAALTIAEGLHREVDELVAHMDVWRTFGAGDRVRRALDGLGERAARAASRAEASRAALSSANEVLAAVVLLCCVWVGRKLSLPMGDGTLIAFAALFFMSYRPLRDLGDARAALERGELALASLEELAPREVAQVGGAPLQTRRWKREPLTVMGVGVVRGEGRAALTSFTVQGGEIVAVVGPTGSGKTTLLRALLGLEPAIGVIRYGHDDLTRRGVGPGERPFAWMPQESPVLPGTLEANLLFDRSDARALPDAMRAIGATRLLDACEGAELGGAGRSVSGGERKWIALARALATGLPVLLLDEPTAGLDRAAQRRVLDALARLRGERTIILVSHQADVVAIADRVVEVGTSTSTSTCTSTSTSPAQN
jgi:ABC-type multidrug transport system fused ATPase/permease subunit